jgi:hypothetical protein
MKKLEDAKIEWKYSKYERFLGPEELKEFSIKIDEKRFNEEVFKNNLNYNLHDFTEYNELDLNTSLNSMIRLRDALNKRIEKEKLDLIEKLKVTNYFVKKLFSIGTKGNIHIFKLNINNKFNEKYKKELDFFTEGIRKIEDKIQMKMNEIISIELRY